MLTQARPVGPEVHVGLGVDLKQRGRRGLGAEQPCVSPPPELAATGDGRVVSGGVVDCPGEGDGIGAGQPSAGVVDDLAGHPTMITLSPSAIASAATRPNVSGVVDGAITTRAWAISSPMAAGSTVPT